MSGVKFPNEFRLERLCRGQPRKVFTCGQRQVDDWLVTKAWQHQEKHLSVTKVLLDEGGVIAGFYTLATGQIDFGDLPPTMANELPHRTLLVAVLAWLGVATYRQSQGLGRSLLAKALCDCHDAGQTFAFSAVILDCINDTAKKFYQQFDFAELPGHPYRLFLGAGQLGAMMRAF